MACRGVWRLPCSVDAGCVRRTLGLGSTLGEGRFQGAAPYFHQALQRVWWVPKHLASPPGVYSARACVPQSRPFGADTVRGSRGLALRLGLSQEMRSAVAPFRGEHGSLPPGLAGSPSRALRALGWTRPGPSPRLSASGLGCARGLPCPGGPGPPPGGVARPLLALDWGERRAAQEGERPGRGDRGDSTTTANGRAWEASTRRSF